MNCDECDLVGDLTFSQEGARTTDTSVSSLKFKEYVNFSVVSWWHHPRSSQSHPHSGKRCYLVANTFWGSVATQLRWGGNLCVCLVARIYR